MTFFPVRLKVLATTFVIAALAWGAVALTRPKPIDSAVLGSEWQCHKTAFLITTCALEGAAVETARKCDVCGPSTKARCLNSVFETAMSRSDNTSLAGFYCR